MSNDSFGKWWPCLRKHHKRTQIWLPHAKRLQIGLAGERDFRYFTLCARPMIDVYMLVKEQVLPAIGEKPRRIQGVSFCECDQGIFPEMKELIGVEESGFLAKLEDLVLFEDVPETQTLDTQSALLRFLEEEGEGLEEDVRAKIEEKMRHLLFQGLFPFDFLNLDFCDRYYGNPPDVMKIHGTIEKLLDWQRRPGRTPLGQDFSVQRFVVAITCRVDLKTPGDALRRLKHMVASNSREYSDYKQALEARAITNLDNWANESPVDFFMSAWPKEIARLAKQKSWDITIHDHAFYDRKNEEGEVYHMVCLVVEFIQAPICRTYLSAVTKCLEQGSRELIPRFETENGDGAALLANLREIVMLRNKQADYFSRAPLPEPSTEILRLRREGVQI